MRANLQILQKTLDDSESFSSSIDFLEAKLMLTISFTTFLLFFALKKINGDRMEDSEAFVDVVTFREIYKKIKPIQERISNHVEEVVKYGRKVG